MKQKVPPAVLVLGLGPFPILVSFLWPSPAAIWIFAFVTMGFPVALIALGVASRDGVKPLRFELAALFLSLQASGLGLIAFAKSGPVLFGLPAGAFLMVGGIWLVPLVLLSSAYPRVFASVVLDAETLERVRERARAAKRLSSKAS